MTRPLNKREQKKLIRKATEIKSKRIYILFIIGYFLSFGLTLYSYVQYHWTLIDYKIPLAIFIISGLLLGGFIKHYFGNVLKQQKVKGQMFWCVFITGSVFTSLFFLLNNQLAKKEVYSIKSSIVDSYITRNKGGSENVIVEVKLRDFTKNLSFSIEEEEKIYASNVILLDVSKGGLGFEIIRNKIPVE